MFRPRLAYVSFDTVPAPKGAATHIQAFSQSLARSFGGIELVTVAGGDACSTNERWPGVLHTELPALGATLIDRVLCFRRFLASWLRKRSFDAIHFRSIFEGVPLLERIGDSRLIFEVNGLPSIELKYRHPSAADDRELMRKIRAQEQSCLESVDLIVTPSGVTRGYLISDRGIALDKVRVIPNGVDVDVFRPRRPPASATTRLLYFGTLSSWQGVELGVRALAQIRAAVPAQFTIVGAGSGRTRDALMALAAKLNVAEHVHVLPPVSQAGLADLLNSSDIALVPLTLNDRNVLQGCCPLKILESMAAGVPVIASDLPVARELGCDGEHFLLVKPGSVDQIAEAALRLITDRPLASRIAGQARQHVIANYTWERAGNQLALAYEGLGISRPSMA